MKKNASGFTIVELLIVIVVIGILAAITIVAYNGIQTRAENIKTISGTKEYIKIIEAYRVQFNDLPQDPSATYVYLGEGYNASQGCVTNTSGVSAASQSTAFNNELKKVVSTLPSMSTKILDMGNGQKAAGAFYGYGAKFIVYVLSGANQPCSAGGTGANYANVTRCQFTFS